MNITDLRKTKFVLVLMMVVMVLLCGCSTKYVTNRTVSIMNETLKDAFYEVEFKELQGRTVVKFKKNSGDGQFKYVANLETGDVSVMYVIADFEENLFTLKTGESVDTNGGYISSNQSGYLVIDANEVSTGKIYISWD